MHRLIACFLTKFGTAGPAAWGTPLLADCCELVLAKADNASGGDLVGALRGTRRQREDAENARGE